MHIFFSGIGGTGIGPLSLIAYQAGYKVSGSDKQGSSYIDYLKSEGIKDIQIGQSKEQIEAIHKKTPIDWLVHSSAVSIENPNHPELVFAKENNIKITKRDEILNKIITDAGQKLIAVAGTHGKTTTTAMAVWVFKELNLPISYSVGAKVSFGDMGHFDPEAKYFVYECDEYDRNFLMFNPYLSLITGIAHDHHDIYPTFESYQKAFRDFISQSQKTFAWKNAAEILGVADKQNVSVLAEEDASDVASSLLGKVNRDNAALVANGLSSLEEKFNIDEMSLILDRFPGVGRRFEKISDNLYTDYAHTPEKIAGCLQMAREKSKDIVVVYEPLTNKRQYEIKELYSDLFKDVKKLYWVPSYLTREDPNQHVLAPEELIKNMDNHQIAESAQLDNSLKRKIQNHLQNDDLVVCLSGGGGGSLDEWLRAEFA